MSITYVINGAPYDENNQPVDTGGSGFTDSSTGVTYSASGEALNAPDTGGSAHFDSSGQLWMANGDKVNMDQYAPTPPPPPGYTGDFWSWINHLSDIGAINYDANNQGGFINAIQNNGWMVPLALAGGVAAGGGLAGAFGAEAAGGAGALDSTAAALGGSGGGGAFVPTAGSSFALPTTGSLLGDASLQELGIQNANAATQEAAQTAAYNTAPVPSGTSLADALKYANQAKQAIGTASSLASLLSPSSALTGAASKLVAGANPSGTATTALTRGNLNPFTQTQNFQVSNPQNLASLLRQG